MHPHLTHLTRSVAFTRQELPPNSPLPLLLPQWRRNLSADRKSFCYTRSSFYLTTLLWWLSSRFCLVSLLFSSQIFQTPFKHPLMSPTLKQTMNKNTSLDDPLSSVCIPTTLLSSPAKVHKSYLYSLSLPFILLPPPIYKNSSC